MLGSVVRQEWRLQRRDLIRAVMLTVMPVVLVLVVTPTYRRIGNGAEQAVPGFAIMFAMFMAGEFGLPFFRDFGWRTWQRTRTLPIPVPILVAGKLLVPLALVLTQLAAVFGVGVAVFGMRVAGPAVALVVLLAVFGTSVVAVSLLVTALCPTVAQFNAVNNIMTLVFAGLGGALVPVALLPTWLQPVAPAAPSYWAVLGCQRVIVEGQGLREIWPCTAVLVGVTMVAATAGALLLRPDRGKESWG
jgi:ABC-2 type transport system permease protein